MSEVIDYIDPKKIKRDGYQPRLNFEGIDELAQSFEEDQQYDPVHVDANNYLIDGERRWRASLKIGVPLKVIRHPDVNTVEQRDAIRDALGEHTDPIGVVERAWNYARRVAKINTGVDYTPQELQEMRENDYDQLQKIASDVSGRDDNGKQKSMGFSELARRLTNRSGGKVNRQTIWPKTRIIFLSPKVLEKIEKDEIPLTHGQEISRLYKNPELMKQIEKEYLEKKFDTQKDVRARVTEYQNELERQAQTEATQIREEQEATEPQEPDTPPPEPPVIPKDIVTEKAQEIADKPPELMKSREEVAEASLLKSVGKGASVEAKLERAKELGINVSGYQERLENAIKIIDSNPEQAWNDGKKLKKEIESKIKTTKQTEEQKKIIEKARKEGYEEAEKKTKEQVKEELTKDPDFIKEVKQTIIAAPVPAPREEPEPVRIYEPPPQEKILLTCYINSELNEALEEHYLKTETMKDEAIEKLLWRGLKSQ